MVTKLEASLLKKENRSAARFEKRIKKYKDLLKKN